MPIAYATLEEYRTDTGDSASDDGRVTAMLLQQSAKLRAKVGIIETQHLTDDQLLLCRALVTDACRKALVHPMSEVMGDMAGMTQTTFSANGFSGSWQNSNGSGSAYFDKDMLKALIKSFGRSQGVGTITPSYGRLD